MESTTDPPPDEKEATCTRVMGLKKAIVNQDLVKEIEFLIEDMAEVKFHASNLLALYGNQIAQMPTKELALLSMEAQFQREEEVFNQNIISQAIALAHSGESENAPPLLVRVAREYFAGPLASANRDRPSMKLEHIHLREQMRVSMKPSFANCLNISTPLNQKSIFRDIYGLSSKEATIVCEHVSTSSEKRMMRAGELYVKRAYRIMYRTRDILEKARREGTANEVALLEKEMSVAEKNVEKLKKDLLKRPELAEGSIGAEFPMTVRKQNGFTGPLLPLELIIQQEKVFVPKSQTQLDQLRYRWNLLSRCKDRAFHLTPSTKYSRMFVRFTYKSAKKLASFTKTSNKRSSEEAFQKSEEPMEDNIEGVLPLIFKPSALNKMKTKSWEFGSSFQTDGVQVQFCMVKSKNKEVKNIIAQARKKTNALKKTLCEADENITSLNEDLKELKKRKRFYDKDDFKVFKKGFEHLIKLGKCDIANDFYLKRKDERKTSIKNKNESVKAKPKVDVPDIFLLGPEATLVGLDTGVRNLFGCAREDDLKNGWTYSASAFREENGEKRRMRKQERALVEAKLDPLFDAASFEDAERSAKTSNYDILLSVFQLKGSHFKTLYKFYGDEQRASTKFLNYIGAKRVFHKLIKKVAPKKTDVVVVGDADFSGLRIKGHPVGLAGKFTRQLLFELGPQRVVYGDEFRSSCLDSTTKTLMHHPPKELAANKNGKLYIKRVYGIYQSSSSGYSCTWNRDVNAAINILKNFRHKYINGEMPREFQRGVKLDVPTALRYRYRCPSASSKKFTRWLAATERGGP